MLDNRPQQLSFTPSLIETNVETKALKPNDPSILIKKNNKISIYGTRVINPGSSPESTEIVFSNRPLNCDDVPNPETPLVEYSSVWNYNPLVYWKDDGHYYFAGVFPYSSDDYYIDNFYLHATYLAGNNTDLMVARKYRNVEDDGKDPVELSFEHATAAVRFLFGKASSSVSDNYSLTKFSLENLAVGGSLTVQTRITDASIDPISFSDWTKGAIGNLADWSAASLSERKNVPYPPDVNNPDGYTQMGWYYMVPQELSTESNVRFSIAYNDEAPVETVLNITDRDGNPGADRWLPNHVYNYYITLTKSGLQLSVRAIPWDSVQSTTEDIFFRG